MTAATRHELDVRLAAATPLRDADVPRIPSALADATIAEIVATDRPVRTRARRRRTALVAALVAVVVVPTTAAAMEAVGIHTGVFADRDSTESVPGEERLDVSSPAIVPIVGEITRSIPLPEGASWARFIDRWPRSEPTVEQKSAIGSEAEWYARCAWMGDWLTARRNGDEQRVADAARMLEDSKTWHYSHGQFSLFPAMPVAQIYDANCI